MIKTIRANFRANTLAYIYGFVLLLLMFGVYASTGEKHLPKMLLYAGALYGSYILLHFTPIRGRLTRFFTNLKTKFSLRKTSTYIYGLFGLSLLIFISHLIFVGGVPAIQALTLDNPIDVAMLRRGITQDSPKFLNYLVSFNLRAFIPFLILYFFVKKQKTFYWIILLVGCFYAFALMQKSYIVCVMAPVFCYALINRKYISSGLHLGLIVLVVFGLFNIANPKIEQPIDYTDTHAIHVLDSMEKTSPANQKGKLKLLSNGLLNRILFVPGKMVSNWFEIVPDQKPFLNGNGYRIVAKVTGGEYHNYFAELYPIMYPKYAARGLKGSVNTASFVMDYANFGKLGLVVSGILLSFFLLIIESMFGNDFALKFSLNFYSILIISSTLLTTTLLTGGWFFILIMYLLFFHSEHSEKSSITA